ncbi:hypothetical protein BGY98DRAFT_1041357, partial [Russula aff. rugulosa BPL654]
MTHGLGLVGHHDACDSPSTENQRFMIACEIHHDTSLRKGTEGRAERRGVGSVAFSPDGQHIVSGSDDQTS